MEDVVNNEYDVLYSGVILKDVDRLATELHQPSPNYGPGAGHGPFVFFNLARQTCPNYKCYYLY